MTVHLDLSQIVMDPRRSGIQRAERELIRHWPGPSPLAPCRFDPASGEMVELPQEILGALCGDALPGGVAAELDRIASFLTAGRVVKPTCLLSAELFVDPRRAEYYRRRPASCRPYWLVYDFLPWLNPGWFANGAAARFMPYLWALRTIPDLAFISEHTRAEFVTRIAREPTRGPVIPMGGDGLGLERQAFCPRRLTFVMLGTIEPRKRALSAMQAVQALWKAGVDTRLTMVGAVAPDASEEIELLDVMRQDARFRHFARLPDEGVREVLRSARAMLFPSEGEGYGIPPVEALHAGIPVIVAASLPALTLQQPRGQVRLADVSVTSIMSAIRSMMDDTAASALWLEAADLCMPTWSEFAKGIAAWVDA